MDYKKMHDEIINQMRLHIERKNCCRSKEEYLDMNPAEPGLAFSDGYYIYQSDCVEAKKLNLKMRNLLAEMKKSKCNNDHHHNHNSNDIYLNPV